MYPSGTTELTMQMLSAGGSVTIDWMQSFETDQFINAFARKMEAGRYKNPIRGAYEKRHRDRLLCAAAFPGTQKVCGKFEKRIPF